MSKQSQPRKDFEGFQLKWCRQKAARPPDLSFIDTPDDALIE
jgi:hypothetical protein